MTRGALTTFSIANDVSKYFAIIPAAFATTYPALQALNFMHLTTPQSAVLSAVIFNALVILLLVPLALRGVPYRPVGATRLLRDNLLIYGVGGLITPFIGIKLIDMLLTVLGLAIGRPIDATAIRIIILFLVTFVIITGIVYPLMVTGIAQIAFHHQANGSLIEQNGNITGSELIGQPFSDPKYFWGRLSATSPFLIMPLPLRVPIWVRPIPN